jgi:hypothetical protein
MTSILELKKNIFHYSSHFSRYNRTVVHTHLHSYSVSMCFRYLLGGFHIHKSIPLHDNGTQPKISKFKNKKYLRNVIADTIIDNNFII